VQHRHRESIQAEGLGPEESTQTHPVRVKRKSEFAQRIPKSKQTTSTRKQALGFRIKFRPQAAGRSSPLDFTSRKSQDHCFDFSIFPRFTSVRVINWLEYFTPPLKSTRTCKVPAIEGNVEKHRNICVNHSILIFVCSFRNQARNQYKADVSHKLKAGAVNVPGSA
jgi:hypothetical protein